MISCNPDESAGLRDETETERALREEWCNGCKQPRRRWGPICGGMTIGDFTHYHSPEWWRARERRLSPLTYPPSTP